MAGKKKIRKTRGAKQPIPKTKGKGKFKKASVKKASVKKPIKDAAKKVVLNYGCGLPDDNTLHRNFQNDEWKQIRLDYFDRAEPDIKSHLWNRQPLDARTIDAICMTHTLERLEYGQVQIVLNECYRLLKEDGTLQIVAHDLQTVGEEISKGKLESAVQLNEARFSPINLIYGNINQIEKGEKFRIKQTGFIANTLGNKLNAAKFRDIKVIRKNHLLICSAYKKASGDKNVKVIDGNNVHQMMFDRDNLMRKPQLPVSYNKPKN